MTFFLPIDSASLAHYFVCACIKPARYFDNKTQDIQDRFPNDLLLSTELGTNDTDCCIELVLTRDEEKNLIPYARGFYLFPIPLPISRIKTVYFRDQRKLEQTLTNINLSAAFIPHSLAKVTSFSNAGLDVAHIDDKLSDKGYEHSLELYDRILGALALMKTAKESYMNYSENYASTLSFFNSSIKEDLERQGRQINEKFFGLFSREGNFRNYIPLLEKRISKEDLNLIASENNQIIERSPSKKIKLDNLSGITYTFAILQSYGVGDEAATQKIDGLIFTNFKEIKDGKAEGIALYYGYNRGYSVFSNSYGTQETGRQIVKYMLDSQLDYYTIESVYQFAFNSNTPSSKFPYIDEWCVKKKQSPKKKTDYMVLDTIFIGKKKPSVFSKDYLLGFLEEIKTFDFINAPLSSLVELIRNRVADDTTAEIEDVVETRIAEVEEKWTSKYNDAQYEIESLKQDIQSQEGLISDLQRRNSNLVEEIELLRSNAIQNDMPIEISSDSIVSQTSSKKGNKVAIVKKGSSKNKPASSSRKKATNTVPDEAIEKQVQMKDEMPQSFSKSNDGVIPFD